ncbi:unnamed protein product [Urochloa decumbens]|uniref:Uncharacterized protein n=1 Tax=Urochloa decumbens TaxID=240449 RepID=A0ABC9B2W1_9POAL
MASVLRLVFSLVGEVFRVMEKDAERHQMLQDGLRSVMDEMEVVDALIKEDKEPRGTVQEIRIRQLQDLAYDVEDFVEGLWEPGAYGKVLVAIRMDPRSRQLRSIEHFQKMIGSLEKELNLKQSSQSTSQGGGGTDQVAPLATSEEAVEENLELQGINEPKSKIVELLSLNPSLGEGGQRRVVSIVGCRGVGKTALARAVCRDPPVSDAFDCVALVEARGCNTKKALLDKIQQGFQAAPATASRDPGTADNVPTEAEDALTTNPQPQLQDILSDKRYLVLIDDVQEAQVLQDTVKACPDNGKSSRIIVTTSVRSVAAACSSGSYVYSMQCLGENDSKCLFWRKVFGDQSEPPYSLATDSAGIFSKCGGLPLALTSVAKHLNMNGKRLDSSHFKEVGKNLGRDFLSGNNNALSLVLRQCYDSLPDYDHRAFLLYLSIFPSGHQIKSKNLVRRLIAEGLGVEEGCNKCFDELVDRCIIEPVQICNNSVVVKSCQVQGIVLEYIIQKSVDKNVVTLIRGQEPLLMGRTVARVRRLSIQSSTKERFDELADKSALRSLTMFKSEPFDLRSCKMLRLLDLEGCTDLDKKFLEGLCQLSLLRYLSLRNTRINKLPTDNIDKLQCLETLDIRGTKVEKLTMEVIMLPKLAYLFGKFQLPDVPKVTNTLSEFLKKKSVLHTLGGFVASRRQGPEHVILLARQLKKVKVWCNARDARTWFLAPKSSSQRKRDWCGKAKEDEHSSKTVEECRSNNFDFMGLLKRRFTSLESVSIVSSNGLCKDFMGSLLDGPCSISSIKLRGNLDSLPDSNKISELGSIRKLQLFSTGLTIKDLSVLKYLPGLEYLKLEEQSDRFCDGIFIVENNRFESLKSLCIMAPMLPKMQFNEGAMKSLTSLYLFCPHSQMQQPSETLEGISHLKKLTEVILHSSMQQDWETVANEHPNRPCVTRQPVP